MISRKSKTWITGLVSLMIGASAISCGTNSGDPNLDVLGIAKKRGGSEGTVPQSKNFAFLINNFAQGKAEKTPWAGWWWSFKEGGISKGAGAGGTSPAAKYDAARGGRTQAQTWESVNHGSKQGKEGWEGHCNGWSAAASLYPEPREPRTVNGVTFGVADIKAILSEAGQSVNYDFYGNRSELEITARDAALASGDVVPDMVFLLLTNYMGRQGHGLLLDRFTGKQVWNQPLAGYKIFYPKPEDYTGAHPEKPGVHRIDILITLWWAEDSVGPAHISAPFEFKPEAPAHMAGDAGDGTGTYTARTLKAEIWLDGPVVFDPSGKIVSSGDVIVTRHEENPKFYVGGWWKNGGHHDQSHPDFIWVPFSVSPPEPLNWDGTVNTDANPNIDINWVETYLLPGISEPDGRPAPISPPPTTRPSGGPGVPEPTTRPSSIPPPNPAPSAAPAPPPAPAPSPRP